MMMNQMKKFLVFFALKFPIALYPQSAPDQLYRESINHVFHECECSSLALFDYRRLISNKPGCKGELQRIDSAWLRNLQCTDTAFHILEPHIIRGSDDSREVILSHYLYAKFLGSTHLVFINDTHFHYTWDQGQSKFILVRKEEINEQWKDPCPADRSNVITHYNNKSLLKNPDHH